VNVVIIKEACFPLSDVHENLMPMLIGRVFHATVTSSLDGINAAGAVLPNDGTRSWGYHPDFQESYFGSRGCVSVFDLRSLPVENRSFWLSFCNPLDSSVINRANPTMAFLFLDKEACLKLIPWTKWKDDGHPPPGLRDSAHMTLARQSTSGSR
jgi:hypothetical protein